jgi:hypothetical protein
VADLRVVEGVLSAHAASLRAGVGRLSDAVRVDCSSCGDAGVVGAADDVAGILESSRRGMVSSAERLSAFLSTVVEESADTDGGLAVRVPSAAPGRGL